MMLRHFDKDIEELNHLLLRMGAMVEDAMARSIRALLERDTVLANEVIARDDEIDRRESVMPDPGELALCVDSAPLDLLVDVAVGEGEQLVEQLAVVSGAPGGVAGREEKGQARRDAAGF